MALQWLDGRVAAHFEREGLLDFEGVLLPGAWPTHAQGTALDAPDVSRLAEVIDGNTTQSASLFLGNAEQELNPESRITLSTTEKHCYVGVTRSQQIWRLPIMADGAVSKTGVAISKGSTRSNQPALATFSKLIRPMAVATTPPMMMPSSTEMFDTKPFAYLAISRMDAVPSWPILALLDSVSTAAS